MENGDVAMTLEKFFRARERGLRDFQVSKTRKKSCPASDSMGSSRLLRYLLS